MLLKQMCLLYFCSVWLSIAQGLSCHSCTLENSNVQCNGQEAVTCNSSLDVCFTEVQRLDFGDSTYTKGCKSEEHCKNLQSLRCDVPRPNKCWTCCNSNLCNINNGWRQQSSKKLILLSLLLIILHQFFT
ncbi:hypothetical protein EB796_022729 [Bugula neritina]|uniref:UPAR/Ly6 domain-containing protein n=1 Tax=Bugula neritina TaxID=10212 RepID=A0A7J7IZG7_BUGNE|nr:hypothetical protein EB796_022729 [Bugula neritina]